MSSTSPVLPLYQSHKLVRALHMAAVEIHQDLSATIAPKEEGFAAFQTEPGWASRFMGDDNDPGVFVRYEDGFASWSPSKAFAGGYLPVAEAATVPDGYPDKGELARIEGDEIVIRVKIATLATATDAISGWPEDVRVADVNVAAQSLIYRLNDEEEDGTTPVHRLFDEAFTTAMEQGDEGFEDFEPEEDD